MEDKNIVKINSGRIQGYFNRGVIKFKGIPYAQPPTGKLRFKPPVPVESWDDIMDVTKFSPVCPQPPSALEEMAADPFPQSENESLTLNVWTQHLDDKKRPVMFFIHGGAFRTGSGRALDGSRLVLRGDVVVVSINYRLGPFGFLYMPDVPDTTPNVGLLDMVAGLKWVRENITRFGGNPEDITIFGESAGAFAVTCLLAMPAARGLFKRAIIQSGYVTTFSSQPSSGSTTYKTLMERLGIKEGDIDSLRKLPYEEIINKLDSFEADQQVALSFTPTIDKTTLPENPYEAIKNGFSKDIDLFVGSNLDETKMWMLWAQGEDIMTEERLLRRVNSLMRLINQDESKSKELVEVYRKLRKTPRDVLDAIETDRQFRISSIRLAEAQSQYNKNTYMYLFSWKTPWKGGKYGAMHALELSFVFGILLDKNEGIFPQKNEETQELSGKMMDSWIAFARTGNPNHEKIPYLPPYDLETRSTIEFDKKVTIVQDPYSNERVAWDDIL
ncbi:MAG: carboxylesterase/lipase family protein [Promethearchaeota archaeon]|jgi:para-nitrobenzyl esterase